MKIYCEYYWFRLKNIVEFLNKQEIHTMSNNRKAIGESSIFKSFFKINVSCFVISLSNYVKIIRFKNYPHPFWLNMLIISVSVIFHKNYVKDCCLMNSQPTFLLFSSMNYAILTCLDIHALSETNLDGSIDCSKDM